MFTGIIEAIGNVVDIQDTGTNKKIFIESSIAKELKIDQSVAHNGVCLTVVGVEGNIYEVIAIKETLEVSALNTLSVGDEVNLERALPANGRLDGHIVQGHVDTVAILHNIKNEDGSYLLTFEYDDSQYLTVDKGSICVNGISLTVAKSMEKQFSVAIIPYTWENTNLKRLKLNNQVNLEFDILGKYVQKLIKNYN